MSEYEFDTIIKNVKVVRPDTDTVEHGDIAVAQGQVAQVAPDLDTSLAPEIIDGRGRLAFPGAVDAHQHWGIYNPLNVDVRNESRAAAQGGVTAGLTYMRTGQYYLNKGGSYADFFPEVLSLSQGRAHIDYAYHIAPMQSSHLEELDLLVDKFGVTSFKIFMFYGGYGLHGRSDDQASFLMTPPGERYDLAHFEFVMRALQGVRERHPEIADRLSLSLHCETAEIMSAYTKMVQEEGELTGLAAYSASRPPHSEGLAIAIASYLAHATDLPTINLLHLTSAKAMESAMTMAKAFPHIDFRREVTLAHLVTDIDTGDPVGGKVNPPLRPRADVEALWEHVLAGDIDWVVSDHACCKEEMKFGEDPDDVFLSKSGFGGAEYLLPGLFSEGRRRGLSEAAIARLVSWNPAQRYGLRDKGTIAPGYDADIALLDPDLTWTVKPEDSESLQEYSPLEGLEINGAVTDVFLRGSRIVENGKVVGEPRGVYVRRA
ncbi:dihydroorotase [Nocardiopsis alkaliphila]|uniref:dihydroorotase n=1 Tax=Nocardiopsis alkaliphila TaxID=225762 RepID=UPI00034C78FA|nr:dihydroorotase family protein [Nocardiopsis alkaliphila]